MSLNLDPRIRPGSMRRSDPRCATEGGWTRTGALAVALCGIAGGIDSFDTQMIGFTGRLIATDLRFPVPELGWLFAAGQFGGVLGALVFGSLADRFGRRRMLVTSCGLAAVLTLAALGARNYPMLLVCRVLTGVGLGGMLPCFLGLGVDAMPPKVRLAMTPVLYASFPIGGLAGAWISSPLISAYGWRGVFAFGAVSLAVIAVVLLASPIAEAPRVASRHAGRVAGLLTPALRRATLPLWALFLLAPAGVYLLVLWAPPLLQLLGVTAARTSFLVGLLNLGALVVSLAGGWLMLRFGRMRVLAPTLLLGALSFTAIADVHAQFGALAMVTTLAGAALGGSMALLVSLAATVYPAELRATGIGWALAVARIGQMTAPIPIGLLLSARVSPTLTLVACGLPTLLSLVPLYLFTRATRTPA